MSMTHKAFFFDYSSYARELEPILVDALRTNDPSRVREFVAQNIATLRDPYEGEPLGEDWEQSLEARDVHEYGDYALTRYYDPADDVGLGEDWDVVQSLLAGQSSPGWSPVLGAVIGSIHNPFDPGKMGSYVQSPEQVRVSLEEVEKLATDEAPKEIAAAVEMLTAAATNDRGLYVTF